MNLNLDDNDRACLISALDTYRTMIALRSDTRRAPAHKLAGELMDRLAKLEPDEKLGDPPTDIEGGERVYLVQRDVDATVQYEAYVIAESPEEAFNKSRADQIVGAWVKGDTSECDGAYDRIFTSDGLTQLFESEDS